MDRMIITQEMIEAGMSDNGALSFKQINLLGFGRHSGWRKRAIGKEIVTENYNKFLALKNVHLKKKNKNSTLLPKAMAFIMEHFSDKDGDFDCPYKECDQEDCGACEVLIQYAMLIARFNK